MLRVLQSAVVTFLMMGSGLADGTAEGSGSEAPRPNIIVIFTDDQGYGDLSCFGAKHVTTPIIDHLVSEGTKLTSFYVAAPVCTPSRAALLTGCYPRRNSMNGSKRFAVALAADSWGLHPDEVTIAEILKSVGYATAIFGKWHLGDQPEFLPTRQGFDEFFGLPYSHDIHPHHPRQKHYQFPPLPLLEGEKVIELDPDADFLTKRITEKAVNFINRHKDKPFFLYIPHPIPHSPLHASPEFTRNVPQAVKDKLTKEKKLNTIDYKTRRAIFGSAISEIDWSVGEIVSALKKNGIDKNTLIIFTSDNGPGQPPASAGPLRGRKGSHFEGGLREPAFIRWPGMIPAGVESGELFMSIDLLPTFAKLAGAKVPSDRVIDGVDVSDAWINKSASPRKVVFYHGGSLPQSRHVMAVRKGKWKLHVKGLKPAALYNLETDIGEEVNLLVKHREVAKNMVPLVEAFEKGLNKDFRPAGHVENPVPLTK